MQYRRNFKEPAPLQIVDIDTLFLEDKPNSEPQSSPSLPNFLYVFYLLDQNNEVIYAEPHTDSTKIQELVQATIEKGLGYVISKGETVVGQHFVETVQTPQVQRVANPHRQPLDMSYGSDGTMAKNQLRSIERIAHDLEDAIENGDRLPQWVHTKVSTALDRLSVAYNYLLTVIERGNVRSNPYYVQNGDTMCVNSWLSSILLTQPHTLTQILEEAGDTWDENLVRIALGMLLRAKTIIEFEQKGKDVFYDRTMAAANFSKDLVAQRLMSSKEINALRQEAIELEDKKEEKDK